MNRDAEPVRELLSTGETLDTFSAREAHVAALSLIQEPELIEAWRDGIALMSALYHPNIGYQYVPEGDTFAREAAWYSFHYRLSIGGAATRTSKAALDLALRGYYHQSYGLTRSVLEAYKRMLFVRHQPAKVFRFYPRELVLEDVKLMPEYSPKPGPEISGDEWKEFQAQLPQKPMGDIDRIWLDIAYRHGRDLNGHAHPDFIGTLDLMTTVEGQLDPLASDLLPALHPKRLKSALHIGLLGATVIVFEMKEWGYDVPGWRSRMNDWIADKESVLG